MFIDNTHTEIFGSFAFNFQPTCTIFKNGILLHYKKVGTRFFREAASYPEDIEKNNFQVDFTFDNVFHESSQTYPLFYKFKKYEIFTNLDSDSEFHRMEHTYKHFKKTSEILNYSNSVNFNEFFFENDKDIVFLIRDPLKRILSGISQEVSSIGDLLRDEVEKEKIINYTKLTEEDLLPFYDYIHLAEYIDDNTRIVFRKLILYLINFKLESVIDDIHSSNYLIHFNDMLYNIKDESKIKIIDLEDCSSENALDFFCKLRGNDLLRNGWSDLIKEKKESNKFLYNSLLKDLGMLLEKTDGLIFNHIKNEALIYNQLKNSKYFVDLK